MRISYQWLKQYIDLPESPEVVGQLLTSTGLEVESIEAFETVKGGLKGLVLGEVITCVKHPNADKLSLTTVNVGEGKIVPIVCGAPNVAVGQRVVVATPGTMIYPTKGEPFTIKSAKIRGEQSEGMICAEDEIGIGESHAGIMVLTTDLPNGTPAATYFKVESDFVFEIGLTPNRADAASHIGVSRDLKAVLNRSLRLPAIDQFQVQNRDLIIPVQVDDAEACPRFSGVSISGVTVKESPDWLKARLKSIGLTPINNIVDITNFICHEAGQPLHAYDANEIAGGKVWVKYLAAGTKFKTLDGKERTLTSSDLMVCDGEGKPMCMAGIFGGENSGITEKTVNVFLEGAYWNPNVIRKSAMHHSLKTDASFRFERGTDPHNTVYAVKRAALLIQEIAGGKISSEVVDVYPNKIEHRTIEVKYKNVDRLIGKELPRERIFSILENLDIEVIDKKEDHFTVSVPPYRVDVVQQADVVEEVLRIYGFNNIELSEIAGTDYLASFPENDINKFKKAIGDMLAGNGFYEIITNSLTNAAYQQKLNLVFNGVPVEIMNKLSEEQGILRQTMLFSGLEVCAYNINRKQKDLKLYEFGKIYWKNNSPEGQEVTQIYKEEERLAIFVSGNIETENWQNKTRSTTYFDLAQQVAGVLQKSSLENVKQEKLENQLFDYGMRIVKGSKEIGVLGKVKTSIARELGIKQEIFYADLSTALLFRSANPKFVVQEVPKFPEVRRDLSLVLDKQVTFEEIRQLVLSTEKKLIKDIIAFDVYEGDKIPEGKKAYALGFTLLDEQKTLKDEEIDKTMNRLMEAFEGKMGAVIRK